MNELNKIPRNAIALQYMQMSESFTILSVHNQKIQDQNERLIRQIEDLQEQIAVLTQQRFGKRTETDNQVLGQLSFSLENMCILNEVEVIHHDCSEEELQKHFPKEWNSMEDEVYKELPYIPARFKVLEHHIKVYAGNSECGGFHSYYINAVPLNRLSEEFLRNGVNIPRRIWQDG